MKKFVYKFLAVVVSFVTAIAMVPLGSGGVVYAATDESPITDNVKYFSTTMYNFNEKDFNEATDESTGINKITGSGNWETEQKKNLARQNNFYFEVSVYETS